MSKLGKVLLMVCLLDLAATVWLLYLGLAVEGNPLLNSYISEWDIAGLVFGKMWLVLIPIFIMEAGPRVCPYAKKRIANYYRSVIGLYICLFVGGNLVQFI